MLQLTARTIVLQNGRMVVDGPRDAVLAHLNKAPPADPVATASPAPPSHTPVKPTITLSAVRATVTSGGATG